MLYSFKKYWTIFILLITGNFLTVGLAQMPPVQIELTASKAEIKFNETVKITAKITSELPGEEAEFFVMVSKNDRQVYEVIGNDRWHGVLKPGESKTLTFEIKPKLPHDLIMVRVTNSFTGFDKPGHVGSVIIKIENAKAIREKRKVPPKENDNIIEFDGIYTMPNSQQTTGYDPRKVQHVPDFADSTGDTTGIDSTNAANDAKKD